MILPPKEDPKSCQDGPKSGQDGPRSPRDGSKTSPRKSCRPSLCIIFFVFDLEWFLAQTWGPFPPPWGAQNDPKIVTKNIRKSRCRKIAWKFAPRQPQTPTGRPKDPRTPPQTPTGRPRSVSPTPPEVPLIAP